MDKVCWEKSELSSQIETLKVQQGQERGEMLMQIRNLEVSFIIPWVGYISDEISQSRLSKNEINIGKIIYFSLV